MDTAALGIADALFSKTKQAALGLLFAQDHAPVHLRELARQAGVSPAMMAKELQVLLRAGLVAEKRDGNRRLFSAERSSPVFEELAAIARKTVGVAAVLRTVLAGVVGVDQAFVFGSVARGTAHAGSDVDLWVTGHCDFTALLVACSQAAARLGRPVNPVLYTPQEVAALVQEDNPFLAQVRQQARLTLQGSADDIVRTLGQPAQVRPAGGPRAQPARTAPAPGQRRRHAG